MITLLLFSERSVTTHSPKESTVEISTERSIIRWKGTKVRRTGSHEGIIRFKEGRLVRKEKNITGGELIVDMNTIEVTDIPPSDPIPRNALKSHLESDFEITRFATASLSIKRPGKSNDELCGNLTIKGITREICFSLKQKNSKSWKTKLILLRDDFKIGEQGSWLEKKLVDQEMELEIEVSLK